MRRPLPDETRMWPRLRIPVLLASLLFAAYSFLSLIARPEGKLSAALHPIATYRAARREEITREGRKAYAFRLRQDAIQRRDAADYDNAYARLVEAANWDPEGDRTVAVQDLRAELSAKMKEEQAALAAIAKNEAELAHPSSAAESTTAPRTP